jgi:hypothetical protein
MNTKQTLLSLVSDRNFFAVWIVMIVLLLAVAILAIVNIRPSDLQIPVRYTSFGITHFYGDKWYYLLNFGFFGLVVASFHTIIAAKLYAVKGRVIALCFLGLTSTILLMSAIYMIAIFRVVSLAQ